MCPQTAQWKVKLAHTLEEIRDTFARISIAPADESKEDAELREVTRDSLRSYLDEVQRMNEEHEHEQTALVEGVIASLPPPPSVPPPPPAAAGSLSDVSASASATPSSSASASTVDTTAGEEKEEDDGFVDIVPRRPLPALPSAQLRK